ncbi:MAG: hypothetical protein HYU52_10725 [Acidobacteria bacterium]|nr:hypothetical protein [Acidobacteriota bacterium]
MSDEFDEKLADSLLSEEEYGEIHHIRHHFETVDEKERAVLGWRATSIYVEAFKREIIRLRRVAAPLDGRHSAANCRCGHGEAAHASVTVCSRCRDGSGKEVVLTGESQ